MLVCVGVCKKDCVFKYVSVSVQLYVCVRMSVCAPE